MTCTRLAAAPFPRRSMLAIRGLGILKRWWYAYWDWRTRKATIMILRSLDCRTLHDIGIHPNEIESLVWDGCDRRRRYDPIRPCRSDGS